MEIRRSEQRFERRVAIDVSYEGTSFVGHTRNLSLSGVFIETDQQLPFGARISIAFKVPTQAEPVEVEGQVRWIELEEKTGVGPRRPRGLGVRFEGLRARDVWALNKWFETPKDK